MKSKGDADDAYPACSLNFSGNFGGSLFTAKETKKPRTRKKRGEEKNTKGKVEEAIQCRKKKEKRKRREEIAGRGG